jgi:hypothetical protein
MAADVDAVRLLKSVKELVSGWKFQLSAILFVAIAVAARPVGMAGGALTIHVVAEAGVEKPDFPCALKDLIQ